MLLETYGFSFGGLAFSKTMLRGVILSIGLSVGLAILSLGSMTMANTSSGEAATEQMARIQAMRLAPKAAMITAVVWEDKDVGFSSRFRCTAHWSQGNQSFTLWCQPKFEIAIVAFIETIDLKNLYF